MCAVAIEMNRLLYCCRKAKLGATTGLIDTIEKELQPSVLNDGGLQDYYTINPSQDVDLAESDSASTDRNIHSTK